MRTYFSRHPEIVSLLALLAAVFLLGGLTFDSSQSQAVPTPAIPPGFRGVEVPVESSGGSMRGSAPAAISAENDLGLLHSDNFDASDLDSATWLPHGEVSLISAKHGQALKIPNKNDGVQFILESINDVEVSARLKLNTRGAEIRLRESDAGFYAVRIFARGQLQLFRGNDVLAEVSIPKIERNKWRNVRVSIIDNTIRVAINKTELIVVQQENPLPAGNFVISKLGSSADSLLLDDISVWLPRIDIPWLRTEAEKEFIAATAMQTRSNITIDNGDVLGLIAALEAANPYPTCPTEASVITLESGGLYSLNSIYSSATLPWGNDGLPRIRCNVIINGQGATIQRDSSSDFRIFSVAGMGTAQLTLNQITLRGGKATASGGGAIYINGGSVYLNDSTVTANTGSGNIGTSGFYGIGIYSIFSTLNVSNSTISDNQVISGFYNGGGVALCGGNTTISNATIQGNTATVGGGINTSCSTITTVNISNSFISQNIVTNYGGGINAGVSTRVQFTITSSTFEENNSGFGAGGLHYSSDQPGFVTISDSVFRNNTSTPNGAGAIDAWQNFSITNSCIIGNSYPSVYNGIFPYPYSPYINVHNNWWGAPDGPSGNASGMGDSATGNVDYSGFLQTPPTGVPCSPVYASVIEVNNAPSATSPSPIPYADEIKVLITIPNNYGAQIDHWRLELSTIAPAGSVQAPDEPIVPIMMGPGNQDGGLYNQIRLLWTGNIIGTGQSNSKTAIFRARRSGIIRVNYSLTVNISGQDHVYEGILPVMRIAVTRLQLTGAHSYLRAMMFWAAFNETSEGRFLSYNPSSTIACKEAGWVTNASQNIRILGLVHTKANQLGCHDSDYLAAQAMLSGMLNAERSSSTDNAYTYFTTNFKGSLGNQPLEEDDNYVRPQDNPTEAGSNKMWMTNSCWLNNKSYRQVLSEGSQQGVGQWLEHYMHCMVSIWNADAVAGNQLSASKVAFYDHFYASPSVINTAVLEFESYCKNPDNLLDYAKCDPVDAGRGLMLANTPEVPVLKTEISDCSGPTREAALLAAASSILSAYNEHMIQLGAPSYGGNPSAGFNPNTSTLAQPVIWFNHDLQLNGTFPVVVCFWQSVTYPRGNNNQHYPR